jgi:hypothetical protein
MFTQRLRNEESLWPPEWDKGVHRQEFDEVFRLVKGRARKRECAISRRS